VPVKLNKAECIDFCARLPSKAPLCPYFHLPCHNFYLNLGRGVCFQNGVKCSWEPSWIPDDCRDRFAVLKKDGRLHV
jgi:hypothetical protein